MKIKNISFALVIGFASLVLFSQAVVAQNVPARPFAEPGTANFPTPSQQIMKLEGNKLDELSKETSYFRAKEYKKEVDQIIKDIDTAGTPNADKVVDIKKDALTALQKLIASIDAKEEQVVSNKSLNDNIGNDIGIKDPAVELKLKEDIVAYFDATTDNDRNGRRDGLKTYMQDAFLDISRASELADIKTILNDTLGYMDTKSLTAKALGTRIQAQNILLKSSQIQELMDYQSCIIPSYKTAGFNTLKQENYFTKYLDEPYKKSTQNMKCDTNPNPTYTANECSLAKINWYSSASKINKDNKYRSWAEGSFGAREEYRLAAETLQAPTCNGTSDCRKQAETHLKLANQMMQNVFHISYYGYDNLIVQKNTDTSNTIKAVDMNTLKEACEFPVVDSMKDGSSGKPEWFSSMTFPVYSTN